MSNQQGARFFKRTERNLVGHVPTIAITPVADGRIGAFESNLDRTWRMAENVRKLILDNVRLPDGTAPRVVTAPEIVMSPMPELVSVKVRVTAEAPGR